MGKHGRGANIAACWIWGCLALLACGDKVELVQAPEPARGAQGESCTSRTDCEEGLACIDNRCVEPGGAVPTDDSGMPMAVADTRGGTGESCTRRADCRTGLACINNICIEEDDVPEGMPPQPLGDRGESCQARNDCKSGLACINLRCIENDFEFDVATKQCFRVQCSTDEDCCSSFTAPLNCPTLQTNCNAGDQPSCAAFDLQCECRLSCQAQVCQVANTCSVDAECGSPLLHCFGGRCAQCMASTDCPGTDQQCVSGTCRKACEHNEQCPLFYACDMGECVEVGCQNARECFFATKNPLSQCVADKCVTPCENDAECGELNICDQGSCRFVGCQTDEECRIFLGVANVPGSDRAVCREPDR